MREVNKQFNATRNGVLQSRKFTTFCLIIFAAVATKRCHHTANPSPALHYVLNTAMLSCLSRTTAWHALYERSVHKSATPLFNTREYFCLRVHFKTKGRHNVARSCRQKPRKAKNSKFLQRSSYKKKSFIKLPTSVATWKHNFNKSPASHCVDTSQLHWTLPLSTLEKKLATFSLPIQLRCSKKQLHAGTRRYYIRTIRNAQTHNLRLAQSEAQSVNTLPCPRTACSKILSLPHLYASFL